MSFDENDTQQVPEGRNGPSWFLIGLVLVAAICAIFVFQNREQTSVDFLFFTVDAQVWVAIAVAIALGVVLDRFVLGWWRRARRRRTD